MKQSIFKGLTAVVWLTALLMACDSKKNQDSSDMADEQNKEAFSNGEAKKDAEFVVETVESNYAELELARIAMTKSNDAVVKDIAGMLEKDHAKALDELIDFAGKKGIAVPVEEDQDSRENAKVLEKKAQAEFNKDWVSELEKYHKEMIQSFEQRWKNSEDNELKAWNNATLPDLRTHLDKLIAYKDQVK